MTNDEAELAGYFARYEPSVARLGKALRAKLRDRLPGLSEVVYFYENQSALVISYSASGRGHEAPCALGVYPDRVNLFFGQGAQLSKADPGKRLQGQGKTVRHVALSRAADLDRAEIEALVAAALKLAKVRPVAGAKGAVIFKAQEQKERALRAAKTTRPASTRRGAKAGR